MRSKSMEDPLRIKLNSEILFSKKKSLLIKSLRILRPLMFLELLKVKDSVELLRDSDVKNYQERLIEVLERLDVLDHGIHQESNGLLLELVKWDTIIELNRIRRFTELEKELIHLMLLLILISLRKPSLLWEDSLDMERLKMTSFSLRDVVLDLSRDL